MLIKEIKMHNEIIIRPKGGALTKNMIFMVKDTFLNASEKNAYSKCKFGNFIFLS